MSVYTKIMNISELLSLYEYRVKWPLKFKFYSMTRPVDKKTVLFSDPYSTDLTDNMAPIYTALQTMGGFNLVKCFSEPITPAPSLIGKIRGRINRGKVYDRFLKEYASAGTVFLTESFLSAYAVPRRDGTQVVQLWHGSGAFKKWGYSTLDKEFGATRKSADRFPMHNCYTLVPVSADVVVPCYAEAFACSQAIVQPLGVPRTDELARDPSSTPHDKTTVLYAPTFRGNNVTSAHCDDILNIRHLHDALGDDYKILLRLHPFARNKIEIPDDCKDFCIDISDMDTNSALRMADILVTDYSSIIFEYSLLGKPIIFYAYDLDEYKNNRDFYFPYEDFVPGPIVTAEDDLISAILNVDSSATQVKSFADTYMSACDGRATERILTYLKLI